MQLHSCTGQAGSRPRQAAWHELCRRLDGDPSSGSCCVPPFSAHPAACRQARNLARRACRRQRIRAVRDTARVQAEGGVRERAFQVQHSAAASPGRTLVLFHSLLRRPLAAAPHHDPFIQPQPAPRSGGVQAELLAVVPCLEWSCVRPGDKGEGPNDQMTLRFVQDSTSGVASCRPSSGCGRVCNPVSLDDPHDPEVVGRICLRSAPLCPPAADGL